MTRIGVREEEPREQCVSPALSRPRGGEAQRRDESEDRNGNEEERATSVATRGGNVASGGKETATGAVHADGTGEERAYRRPKI